MIAWAVYFSAAAYAANAGGFDHDYRVLATVYDGAVTTEGVRYDRIAERRASLDAFLATTESAPLDTFTQDQRIAFYVNVYNARTIALVLDALPITSIKEIDGSGPWATRTFAVGGERLTLDDIEHRKLRPMTDARIHAVVNCASKGCPPLPAVPLSGKGLDAQLTAGAKRWVGSNAWTLEGDVLEVSKIFYWYADDFASHRDPASPQAPKLAGALGFLREYGDTGRPLPAYRQVVFDTYDWTLNAVSP